MKTRILAVAASGAFFAVLVSSAADNAIINLFVTAAKQDSPVQIVGFKLPAAAPTIEAQNDEGDRGEIVPTSRCKWCPRVVLHNTTTKQAKDVVLRLLWEIQNVESKRGTRGQCCRWLLSRNLKLHPMESLKTARQNLGAFTLAI